MAAPEGTSQEMLQGGSSGWEGGGRHLGTRMALGRHLLREV